LQALALVISPRLGLQQSKLQNRNGLMVNKAEKLGVEAHRDGLGLSIEMLIVDLEIWWW
jgi:hypothetical protein